MKDRLLQLLTSENMTALKFAEIMEIRPSNVSHILSGRNNPSFDFVARLLRRFPELNPDWVLNGVGDMHRTGFKHDFSGMGDEGADEATAVATLFSDENPAATDDISANPVPEAATAPVNGSQSHPYALNAPTPAVSASEQNMGAQSTFSTSAGANGSEAVNSPSAPSTSNSEPGAKLSAVGALTTSSAAEPLQAAYDAQAASPVAEPQQSTIDAQTTFSGAQTSSTADHVQNNQEQLIVNDAQQAQKLVIIYADNTFEILTPKSR